MDPRLDERALCWDCWVVAIKEWRAEMRAAGRCPNCGAPAEPFIFCQRCRNRSAEKGRAKHARHKAADAEQQAAVRQKKVLHAGERGGQQSLIDWRATVAGPALIAAFTAASGNYAETLARLGAPWWRIVERNYRSCRADGSWPRHVLITLGQNLGVRDEMRRVRRTVDEERRARRASSAPADSDDEDGR